MTRVKKLDKNSDGLVSEEEFVDYYDQSLSKETELFEQDMRDFHEAARISRQTYLMDQVRKP